VTPIRFYGYRTKAGTFERRALATVHKYLPRILGKYEDQIREVRIVGYKRPIWGWTWGYHWLYKDKIVRIVLPRNYRGRYRSQWLIVHELAHAAQLISGKVELTHRAATVYYNGKPYRVAHRHKKWTWRDPAGRQIKNHNLPWEAEANKVCRKMFRRDQYGYTNSRRKRAA